MLSALLITLREGLEAALIVSIIAAFLVRSNERRRLRDLWIGVAAAAGGSLLVGTVLTATGSALSDRAQEIYEGLAGLLAVGVLTWMIFFMRRHARAMRSDLESSAARAIASDHPRAIQLLAFATVGREGLETALFLNASFNSSSSPAASGGGAVLGLVIAIVLAYGVYRGGVVLNMRRFFQVTGALLIVIGAGLFAHSIHELNEAGFLNVMTAHAWDTGSLVTGTGLVGSVLRGLFGYDPDPTVLEALVYWAYLLPTMLLFFGPRRLARRAEPATVSERAA